MRSALPPAGAAEDDQQALEGVQTVWREELEGLRAEIAASPVSKRGERLTALDKMTSIYLQKERNSVQTTWAVLHIKQVGIRNALPAIISIALAVMLDLAASAAVKVQKSSAGSVPRRDFLKAHNQKRYTRIIGSSEIL